MGWGECEDTGCMERFAVSTRTMRAAAAYGVDYRELSHNAFLAAIARGALGPAFIRRIAAEAAQLVAGRSDADVLEALAAETHTIDASTFNRSDGNRRRPDLRVDGVAGGSPYSLVLELKVQAADGQHQLAGYVEQAKADGAERVVGVLVRIPGTDAPPGGDAPVLDGAAVGRALSDALKSTRDVDPRVAWLAEDYLETLRFLVLADHMATHHADTLATSQDEDVQSWWEDNRRWVYERVARELGSAGRPLISELKDTYVNKDANGAFTDFWWTNRFWVQQARSGAGAFVKWRVSNGLEVHAVAEGYFDGTVTGRSQRILDALVEAGRRELAPHWEERGAVYSNRPGKSRMIARLPQASLSVAAALETLRTELPTIEGALDRAVARLLKTGVE